MADATVTSSEAALAAEAGLECAGVADSFDMSARALRARVAQSQVAAGCRMHAADTGVLRPLACR
eukprot:6195404-Alexandrium_andersonii.AAC.1